MRKLCLAVYDDFDANKQEAICQRLADHGGAHEFSVEYKQIKMHPWAEVRKNFAENAAAGAFCLQSWTCRGCGAVQRMAQVNGFFTEGVCENCDHVTNLKKHGCNFTLMMPIAGTQRSELRNMLSEMGYKPPRDN